MTIRVAPPPALSASMVRRRRPLRVAPPSAYAPAAMAEPSVGWSDDLRFFVTCYAAGVVFFLVMLS